MQVTRLKRRIFSNIGLARTILILFIIAIISGIGWLGFSLFRPISPFLFGQNLTSSSGRTNILLLGIRGTTADGPDMTDTMIMASVRHIDGQISLITLPRDLWSDVTKAKINSSFHLGSTKAGTEGGILLSKTVVSQLSDTPVHYAAIVDFSLFTKFLDTIGGVDINVQNSFEDKKYPVPGRENDLCDGDTDYACRYETLKFEKGLQHMNGETALKFVRSRQSEDLAEGTDFARSKRQELLISSVKSKLFSQSPRQYLDLYRLVRSSIVTDLKPNNYFPLAKILLKSRKKPFSTYSINQDNLLENPPTSEKYQKQWVLIPKKNDPKLIPNYFQDILK